MIALFLVSCAAPQMQAPSPQRPRQYSSNKMCEGCHVRIFRQYKESYHAKAFSNPLFQGQYFKELLPKTGSNPDLLKEAEGCIACHAPAAYMTLKGHVEKAEQVGPDYANVTCDFCHSIKGYEGKTPGEGNYISVLDDLKCGPFKRSSGWHSEYCVLPTKSEYCGICHNAVNHHGLEIKSTYTEWKESIFAEEGIQCQNCHMNRKGFLAMGKAFYDKGKAAAMTVGEAPYRNRLYTHRFPGAHSRTQIAAAGSITVSIEKVKLIDRDMTFQISVNNSKTGHKMPSGSADLRLLWVEVAVHTRDMTIPVPAGSAQGAETYDVAGKGPFDQDILADEIPQGSRIYRAVFVDAEGKPTLSSYDAVKSIFDNRLNAGEIRDEKYHFKIPADLRGEIAIEATLKYLPYPTSFSRKFGQEEAEPFVVGAARKALTLRL